MVTDPIFLFFLFSSLHRASIRRQNALGPKRIKGNLFAQVRWNEKLDIGAYLQGFNICGHDNSQVL